LSAPVLLRMRTGIITLPKASIFTSSMKITIIPICW
jgi:hypothetical protein